MSQALLASARIVVPYNVGALPHIHHAYARGLAPVGGSYNINSRALDNNDIVWTAAATQLTNAIASVLPVGSTFGTTLLQQLVDSVWVSIAAVSLTPAVTANAVQYAAQMTMTLQDVAFKKVKVVLLETCQPANQHISSPTGGDATLDTFASYYTGTHGNAADPYNWLVGRGNRFLLSSPFVYVTTDLNDKIRRARGTL